MNDSFRVSSFWRWIGATLFLFAHSVYGVAQSYPTKNVRIVAPYAGTGGDFIARWTGQRLNEKWGKPVVVENRGSVTLVAGDYVAKAQADGYTLLIGEFATATSRGLFPTLPYDPVRDLTPVALAMKAPLFLVGHPALAPNNIQEFVALARKGPGTVRYSSAGPGTAGGLGMRLFDLGLKLGLVDVPYKGSPPALTAVLGRETQVSLLLGSVALSSVEAQKLKAYAISSRARFSGTPDIPTVSETVLPGFEATAWNGFFVPARTPAKIIDQLNREIAEVLKLPETHTRFIAMAMEPSPSTAQEFDTFFKSEVAKWGKVIQAAGIKVE